MRLIAVRHGQASFSAEDYDQLSGLGDRQASALGRWLRAQGEGFDHVVRGNLRRHAQTLAAIERAFAETEGGLPAAEVDPDFDEFDHRAVAAAFVASHPTHPVCQAAEGGRSRDVRVMVELLRQALQSWAGGELDGLLNESWAAFKQRTRGAMHRLHRRHSGRNVLLVSSGGVIAQLVAEVLQIPDLRSIELNMSLQNSAYAELRVNAQTQQLASWNSLPHLADERALWTFV